MERNKYPLHDAVKTLDLGLIHAFLRVGADANQKDDHGLTPLHYAIMWVPLLPAGQTDADFYECGPRHKPERMILSEIRSSLPSRGFALKCVESILHGSIGINLDVQDNYGVSPLHLAAKLNKSDCLVSILRTDRHLDINIQDKDGRSPLHLAVLESSECLDALLSSGRPLDINIQDENGRTPLHLAAQSNLLLKNAKSLLHGAACSGVDVNIQDRDGRTPLHLAVQSGSTDFLSFILVHSKTFVDPNIQDKHGRTPLNLAIRSAATKCVHYLLDNGKNINVNLKDNFGQSPLDGMSPSPGWEEIIPKFLERGVDCREMSAWFQRWRNSKNMNPRLKYWRIWMNAENAYDYASLELLLRGISTSETCTRFGPMIWQWEVPAVLNLHAPNSVMEVRTTRMESEQRVALVRHCCGSKSLEESAESIQATTFGEYLSKNFNTESCHFVVELLELVRLACLDSTNLGFSVGALSDGSFTHEKSISKIFLTCTYSSISVNLRQLRHGFKEVQHLIEALDWVCRAMRIPETGDSLTLSTATYRFERQQVMESEKASPRYCLRPYVKLEASPLPSSSHDCWRQLFQSCVIADTTFPQGRHFGRGLEVSFDLMISLAAVEFCLTVEGGVVLVGYQTLLYPTEIQGGCAQFHMITTKSGQINPYTLKLGKRVLTADLAQFLKMTCFLGWCDTAQINLGTKQLPATVRWSGGRTHGRSLQLDGYSILSQAGASAPLSAVLGLQANFKYGSHRRQFTPLGNYCKLLRDTALESALVYDAVQRRSWLVPKLSLLLHMSHAHVLKCESVQNDQIPYVEPHADAVEVVKVLEPLGDTVVYGGQGNGLLFRQLLLGLNTNLLQTVASARDSSGKTLFGFEFMDVVNEPGRGTCMKELKLLPSGKIWLKIANAVDAVVVCSELGEAIIAADGSNKSNTKCNKLPKDLDYLAATLPCLARLAEREGVDLTTTFHKARIAERISWSLNGNPFQVCQHSNNETCWQRSDLVQQLVSEDFTKIRLFLHTQKAVSQLSGLPLSGAVVFGQRSS